MNFDAAPASKRINDPEKAQAMANAGNKLRKDHIESPGADLDDHDAREIDEALYQIAKKREGPSADPRIGYAARYQYTPRELNERRLYREETVDKRERQRTAKMAQLAEYYDRDTEVGVRDRREDGASEDDINKYEKARRDHKDEWVVKETEEILAMWDQQEKAHDVQQRIQDMERKKPEDIKAALKAIDSMWDSIDDALRKQKYDHRNYGVPEESLIDEQWADYVLKTLNNLRDQLRFEGSVSVRTLDDLRKARLGTWDPEASLKYRPHIEEKWLKGIGSLGLGGESYIETPDQERERRISRDNAIEKYMNAM